MTIDEFITKHSLTMRSKHINKRPDDVMDDMPKGSRHYECSITNNYRTLTIYFTQGPAIKHDPELDDVLDCLRLDAEAGSLDPFEFMSEFGYDEPKKAKQVWEACARSRELLLDFLGEEALQELLECEGL